MTLLTLGRTALIAALTSLAPRITAAQANDAPCASDSTTGCAFRFVLDYDVPESPGFVALGVAPTNVTRGSAAKPAVLSLVGQALKNEKLASGVALDFNPYFVFGGRVKSVRSYNRHAWQRHLANLQLSVATVQAEGDTASLRLGVGGRLTLFDRGDPLADTNLANTVSNALASAARVDPRVRLQDEEVGAPIDLPDTTRHTMIEAYTTARKRGGGALSVGWGLAAFVHGSVFVADSIDQVRHRVWLAYRHRLRSGATDLLAVAQWRERDSSGASVRLGAAVRGNGAGWNLALEVFYDSDRGTITAGHLGVGGNGEWRFGQGLGLVAAIATEPVEAGGRSLPKIRVRTSVRWNPIGASVRP